jgi:hypothetical protein
VAPAQATLVKPSAQASVLVKARRLLETAESKTGVTPVAKRVECPRNTRRDAAWPAPGGRVLLSPGELARRIAPQLAPGTVAEVTGSLSALWEVAAVALGPEDWAAIAALPKAGLLAAAEAGLPLSRAVVVPDLGPEPLRVVAGLVDAYGLVVAGPLGLSAGDRRRVEARLRFTGGRLVTAGRWAGAGVVVQVDRTRVAALGENQGLARDLLLECEPRFKGGFEGRRS